MVKKVEKNKNNNVVEEKTVKKVEHVDTQLSSKKDENIPSERKITIKSKSTKYPDVSGALILITLGVLLLLNNFGVLPWDIWGNIWRFWPIFIIIAGFNMLFTNSWWKTIIIFIVTVLLLAGVVVYSLTNANVYNFGRVGRWLERNIKDEDVTYDRFIVKQSDYKNVTKRRIELKNDIGTLKVRDKSTNWEHVAVYGWYYKDMVTPKLKHVTENDELKINFTGETSRSLFSFWGNKSNVFKANIGKSDMPTRLNVRMTSGNTDLYLRNQVFTKLETDITSGNFKLVTERDAYIDELLKIKMTSGNSKIDLTGVNNLPDKIEITVTSGNVDIKLPDWAGMEIEYDVTTGSVKIKDERVQGKGKYNVDTGEKIVKVTVRVTSGNVVVR